MKPRYFFLGSALFLVAAVIAGCTTGPAGRTVTEGAAVSRDLGDKAFHYRRQAAELSAMAQRLEFEAQWYAREGGQDSERAKRARELAKEVRSAAEEADQLAREYRSQLPHNQVY
jgi:hypothetical protein